MSAKYDPTGGGAYTGKTSICTYGGTQFYPLDPDPAGVFIGDIAHALSMRCRYSGHTHKFYSIAEHSLLVMHYIEYRWPGQTEWALNGLLHDASEAYLADISGPVKRDPRVGKWWYPIEEQVERAVADRFFLPYPYPTEVHIGDKELLKLEIPELMSPTHWWKPAPPDEWASKLTILSLTPGEGKALFMEAFERLMIYG